MNTFRILVFGHPDKPIFVDESMLGKGIYQTDCPILHRTSTTIDRIIEVRIYVYELDPEKDEWCINIRQCRLQEYELIPKK